MRVVFVHGFTQSPSSWDPVISRLPDPLAPAVVAPPVPDGLDFVATARALDRGPATYVGYSMGGRLCLQLALERPDLVERLVLVSASPGIEDASERAERRAADDALARGIERDGVDRFLERWLDQPLFATLPRDAADVGARRAANTVDRLTHQLRALGQGAQPCNWGRLPELRMPVLLVAGELDLKYVDAGRRMAAALADARLDVIAGAGHACHLEQPELVAHLLSSWLTA
jgi:2-succinyl-6-hydroxy-2,4-cyclohexadiene-1-carboxylate synthase